MARRRLSDRPTNEELGLAPLRCMCGKRRNVAFCPECRYLDGPFVFPQKPKKPRPVRRNCQKCRAPYSTRTGAIYCSRCSREIIRDLESKGYLDMAG